MSQQAIDEVVAGPNANSGTTPFADLVSMRVVALFVLMRRSMNLSNRRDFGFSELEWRIMTQIGPDQEISLNGLAELLTQDAGQLSRTVKSMVERGLLTRSRNKRGPEIAIALSPQGKALRLQMEEAVFKRDNFLTAGIAHEDLEGAREILETMIERARILLDDAKLD